VCWRTVLQVESEFLPWLTQQALVHVEQEAMARAVLQQIVADAVAAQVGPAHTGAEAVALLPDSLQLVVLLGTHAQEVSDMRLAWTCSQSGF
jgi:hypothetical protein